LLQEYLDAVALWKSIAYFFFRGCTCGSTKSVAALALRPEVQPALVERFALPCDSFAKKLRLSVASLQN
jgi:hypothetical protein